MNAPLANESAEAKMQENVRHLRAQIVAHPFAKDLSPEFVTILADCAMETQFAPGEIIFREGDFANRFYFLLEGEVVLESRAQGGPIKIATIHGGDVLGWSWLFAPYYWHFAARAVKATRAIFFYGTWLREACEQNQKLGYEVVKRMAEVVVDRLQATRLQLITALAGGPQTNNLIMGAAAAAPQT